MKSEHSIVYGNLFQPAQFLDWLKEFLHFHVSSVDPVAELSSNDKNEDMERDQVDQKDISTPGAEHVEECDSTETGPVDITTLDPEAVSEEHTKGSNTLIVITAS